VPFQTHILTEAARPLENRGDLEPLRSLIDQYREVRSATAALCEPLAPEDCVIQSMPDASPTKWHLAHTSWFFEEFVLRAHARDYRSYDDAFSYLFNSYYEAVGPRHERPHRGLLSRPTVQQTFAYRAYVDEQMLELLNGGGETSDLARIVTLGLHHEQQHQELLLTDIKHALSCNPLLPAYTQDSAFAGGKAPLPLSFIEIDGGLVEAGRNADQNADRGFDGFAFDNESPRHRTYLQPFKLANRLVTNGEFREFMADGGYRHAEFWLSDGWATVQREQWTRPIYWQDSLEREFTLLGLRKLDPNAPVCHLSYYEADAYARWREARLPTEFEWEHAASGARERARIAAGNFVDNRNWHPVAADAAGALSDRKDMAARKDMVNRTDTAREHLVQMFGDVWEWTQSAYSPYPGFVTAAGAIGEYNGKFMVSQLVLRGGSCVTPRSHIRPTYRNFFYPTARWQFSGVRLAKDA